MNFLNNSIIGVLISIILIYALLSIVVSILVEWWNHLRSSRGILLKQAILNMLDDKLNLEYGKLFYNHPMICGIRHASIKHLPQYISPSLFADVVIDVFSHQTASEVKVIKKSSGGRAVFEVADDEVTRSASLAIPCTDPLGTFKSVLGGKMADSPLRDLLVSFYSKAEGKYPELKILLEKWFDEQMSRVSDFYKTKLRTKLIFAGFVVALALNVDSIYLFKMLSLNKELTGRLVLVAEGVADNYTALLDSQKTEIAEQIAVFRTSLDSLLSGNTPGSLDTTKLQPMYSKIDKIVSLLDSNQQQYYSGTKQVLGFINDLGIPVGWSNNNAPVSWFLKKNYKKEKQQEINSSVYGLHDYFKKRDFNPSVWDVILYFLGICITGFALSFGAPFWFDALVKLVNIRRAGNKPVLPSPTK